MFNKPTGGSIEIFLLEPANGNYLQLHQKGHSEWHCLVGGVKKWKNGEPLTQTVSFEGTEATLTARMTGRTTENFLINFTWNNDCTFSEILEWAGKVPLPPYIKRMAGELDKERYQTIYARHDGSVAAPTAGLHFTERIFERLKAKEIGHSSLTLHVGAGTFKPVSSSTIGEHVMHEEHFEVSREAIQVLANPNIQPVAVGTTSLRTLESLYWIAYKILFTHNVVPSGLQSLSQWEHITFLSEKRPDRHLLFASLLQWMDTKEVSSIRGKTGICITPGYSFQVIKALATNFHQPKSTLLLLIAAICGDEWKRIYGEALVNGYRFLSYGDGSLLFPNNTL